MRKVYVEVNATLLIEVEEGVTINEIIEDMKYDFQYREPDYAEITDYYITGWDIIDTK